MSVCSREKLFGYKRIVFAAVVYFQIHFENAGFQRGWFTQTTHNISLVSCQADNFGWIHLSLEISLAVSPVKGGEWNSFAVTEETILRTFEEKKRLPAFSETVS